VNLRLPWVNLAGVALLAALCTWQWMGHRRLELDRARLEGLRTRQEAQLEELTRQGVTQQADLEFFRQSVTWASLRSRTQEVQISTLERDLDLLRAERDGSKSSLSNWVSAVQERDERLEQAAAQLHRVVGERDALALRLNELAGRQNGLVEELNTRTREYHELATKYAELAKANGAAGSR
jgi:chromosome segregation ATPase